MATEAQIAEVRDYIAEPDDTNGWTDEKVGTYIDAAANTHIAAANIWSAKATKYSTLVDVSESGSTRHLGSLLDNALRLSKQFRTSGQEIVVTTAESTFVIAKLVRP